MNAEQFAQAVASNISLILKAFPVGNDAAPRRTPETPCAPCHLTWMLWEAREFYAKGKIEKANRWLGYVQGVLAATGAASLDELKKANMPEGEEYDARRI